MPADGVRKVVTLVEDVHVEGGRSVTPPTRMVAVGAVVANPLAGDFAEDLSPLVDAYCEPLGALLTRRALDLLGAAAEGFGKGALVGLDGDVEHGSAIIHNLRFGNHVRDAVAHHVVVIEGFAELLGRIDGRLDGAARALLDRGPPFFHRLLQRMRRRHPMREPQVEGLLLGRRR